MRFKLIAFFLLVFAFQTAHAQSNKVPKNLKQAIKLLWVDCPDSLKAVIENTADNKLINICYPWHSPNTTPYRVIYNWLNDKGPGRRLDKYLTDRGVKYNPHQQTVVLIAFKQALLGQRFNQDSILKPYQHVELKWKKEDEIKITADSLRGVYIPKDLQDCFTQLNIFFNDSTKAKVKTLTESQFSGRYHLGFGTWLRNNWGLWSGSRLWAYFNKSGLTNAEDMSGIILCSYHRFLLGQPLKVDEQIKFYKDYWVETARKQSENKKKEFAAYHLGDTLKYNYSNGYATKQQEESFDNETCRAQGIVLDKNVNKFFLKIKIIETCDSHGIITYDNENIYVWDKKLKQWLKESKRKIIKSKKNKELWFNYSDWEAKE